MNAGIYGRRTKLRLLTFTQASPNASASFPTWGPGWESLMDRDDYEFFAPASGSPNGTSASRR